MSLLSLPKDIPAGHHTLQEILSAGPEVHPTHPWACILSLVSHQDVKGISFLQRKYGRYKNPMVALVVVFGSFPSCSPISRDPEGDECTTRGLNTVTERNCFLAQAPQHITHLIDKTAVHLSKQLQMSIITHKLGDTVTCCSVKGSSYKHTLCADTGKKYSCV